MYPTMLTTAQPSMTDISQFGVVERLPDVAASRVDGRLKSSGCAQVAGHVGAAAVDIAHAAVCWI